MTDPDVAVRLRAMAAAFAGSANQPILRTGTEIAAPLGDYPLVGDGVVDISSWPDAGGTITGGLAAVGVHPDISSIRTPAVGRPAEERWSQPADRNSS